MKTITVFSKIIRFEKKVICGQNFLKGEITINSINVYETKSDRYNSKGVEYWPIFVAIQEKIEIISCQIILRLGFLIFFDRLPFLVFLKKEITFNFSSYSIRFKIFLLGPYTNYEDKILKIFDPPPPPAGGKFTT